MTFFEPLVNPEPPWEESGLDPVWPDIEDAPEHEMAAWMCPPPDHLGASVALERLVHHDTYTALMLTGAWAYRNGVWLELRTVARRRGRDLAQWQQLSDRLHNAPPFFHPQRQGDLRVGVELSDGRRATADDRHLISEPPAPPAVTVWHEGSHGLPGRLDFRHSIWLWPLPDTPSVDLWVVWPGLDIPETRTELDAEAMRGAAPRSRPY